MSVGVEDAVPVALGVGVFVGRSVDVSLEVGVSEGVREWVGSGVAVGVDVHVASPVAWRQTAPKPVGMAAPITAPSTCHDPGCYALRSLRQQRKGLKTSFGYPYGT